MNELDNRTLGLTGVSIGTSLAFEAITNTGEFESNTNPPAINDMENLWINIRTLARNAHEAVDSNARLKVNGEELGETILQEMEIIQQLFEDYPTVKVSFYLNTYDSLNRKFPKAIFRDSKKFSTSTKKYTYELIQTGACKYVTDKTEDLMIFDTELKSDLRCVLLTHLPLDLMSYSKFADLQLLESHTGTVKSRKDWYSKLYNGKKMEVIPFTRTMLQIFGDSNMFAPQDLTMRRKIIDVATKYNWHPLVTEERIRVTIDLSNDRELNRFYQEFTH